MNYININYKYKYIMSAYDEHYGDIFFEEEDPQSEFYNPKCCTNVYVDLASGKFDYIYLHDDESDEDLDILFEK